MVGVVALAAAGVGTFASAGTDTVDGTLTSAGYETAQSPEAPAPQEPAVDSGVDVSRGFDRPKLEEHTERQAAERAAALQEVARDIAATAEAREREEKARALQEKKARVRQEKKARALQVKKARAQQQKKARNQWVLPVKGYRLTARFGQQGGMWSSGAHTGLDFAGPAGTEIVSMAAGTVTSAGYDGAYGNRTVVTLADGTEIAYCHQSSFVAKVGDKVQPGDLIGYVGATGNVTGPHLHLEVELPGSGQTDPESVMRAHGVTP